MRLRVGTSGYAYDQWEDVFYPAGLPADERLAFYAARFDTVEINHTFHRMPRREVLQRWAQAVPPGFHFVIKASRRITHEGRLKDEDGALAYLLRQLESLGERRGPILFQTPPYLPARPQRLLALVDRLPAGVRAAFEFRHASWRDPAIEEQITAAGHAVCTAEHATDAEHVADDAEHAEHAADAEHVTDGPEHVTDAEHATDGPERAADAEHAADGPRRRAPWGYLRLRAPRYDDAQLLRWLGHIRCTWDEAYVFFKHEQQGPRLVERMTALARQLPGIEVR